MRYGGACRAEIKRVASGCGCVDRPGLGAVNERVNGHESASVYLGQGLSSEIVCFAGLLDGGMQQARRFINTL